MVEFATLQIKVDSTGVTKAIPELSKLEKQAVRTENANRRLATSYLGSNAALERANLAEQRNAITKQRLAQQADKLAASQKKLEGANGSLAGSFGFLNRSIFTIKNIIGTVMVASILKSADNIAMLRARVEQSTKSNDEFTKSFAELKKMSQQTGATLSSAVDVFQRLSFSRKEIGATVDDMLSFTKTVQSLAVISGTSTQNLEAGLRQLGQSMSSGLVRAEEFNSLLENIPAVANKAAEGLGLTTGQLRLLVIEGKMTSKMMFDVIKASEGVVAAQMEEYNSHHIMQVSFNKLKQAMVSYIDDTNQSYGVTAQLASIMTWLSENLPIVASRLVAVAAGMSAFMLAINIPKFASLMSLVAMTNPWTLWAGVVAVAVAELVLYEQQTGKVTESIDKLNKKLYEASYNTASFLAHVMNAQIPSQPNYSKIQFGEKYFTPEQRVLAGSQSIINSGVENFSEIKWGEKDPRKMGLSNVEQENKKFLETTAKMREEALKLFDSISNKTEKLSKEQKALNKLVEETATAQEKYNATVKELERLRGFAKTKEEITAIERGLIAAKKELDEVNLKVELDSPLAKSFKRLFEEIDDGFKDAFKDAFTKTEGGFKKMIEGFKSTFKNLLAELAYQALVRPIIVSVLGAAGGSMGLSGQAMASITGTQGGMGGIGNIFGMGKSAMGLFSSGGGAVNAFGAKMGFGNLYTPGVGWSSGFTSASLGSVLGAAGLGFAGGGILAGLMGGNKTGGSIGGGLGATAGMMIGGPLGALIGGAAGGALGGMFGNNKVPRQTLEAIIGSGGVSKVGTKGGSSQDAKAFGDQIYSILTALTQKVGANIVRGFSAATNVGQTDPGTFFRVGSSKEKKVSSGIKDSFAIVRAAVSSGVIGGGDPVILEIMKKSLAISKDIEQVMSDIDFAVSILNDEKINPLQDALKALDTQFQQMRDRAVQLGIPLEKVNEQLSKQKDTIIRDFLSPLQEFLDSQAISGESSLSPVKRLAMARSMFDQSISGVGTGEFTDMNKLAEQAKTLLDIGRDVFASSEAFAALESFVRQSISGVAGTLGAPGALDENVSRDIIISNAEQTSLLAQINVEIQALREENQRLRKSMERIGNALVVS